MKEYDHEFVILSNGKWLPDFQKVLYQVTTNGGQYLVQIIRTLAIQYKTQYSRKMLTLLEGFNGMYQSSF